MRAVPLLANFLAGCQLVFPLAGGPSDAQPADAFVCLSTLDCDDDTVPNSNDNCPEKANTNQANEDRDPLGDACDPCPITVLNTDTDGDGVGDECDPNPDVKGDAIALFEGFATSPVGWMMEGTWNYQLGDMAGTATQPGPAAYLAPPIDGSVDGTVTISFTPEGTPVDRSGAGLGHTLSTVGGLACQVSLRQGTGRFGYENVATRNLIADMFHDWPTDQPYTIASQRKDGSSKCMLDGLEVSTDFDPPGKAIAARVDGMTIRVHWLLFVTSP